MKTQKIKKKKKGGEGMRQRKEKPTTRIFSTNLVNDSYPKSHPVPLKFEEETLSHVRD